MPYYMFKKRFTRLLVIKHNAAGEFHALVVPLVELIG
jgi:hypothetical protein